MDGNTLSECVPVVPVVPVWNVVLTFGRIRYASRKRTGKRSTTVIVRCLFAKHSNHCNRKFKYLNNSNLRLVQWLQWLQWLQVFRGRDHAWWVFDRKRRFRGKRKGVSENVKAFLQMLASDWKRLQAGDFVAGKWIFGA